jgi:hypothetical protein
MLLSSARSARSESILLGWKSGGIIHENFCGPKLSADYTDYADFD